jgi:hypothetical protein
MLVNLSLSPGYRLKITMASRMSELTDRVNCQRRLPGDPPPLAPAPPGQALGAAPARRGGSWRKAKPGRNYLNVALLLGRTYALRRGARGLDSEMGGPADGDQSTSTVKNWGERYERR